MAVCFDLGDSDPRNAMGLCHSRYKQECGRRLALALMALLPPNLGKTLDERSGSAPIDAAADSSASAVTAASGPSITAAAVVSDGTIVELTVADGKGMRWAGTKQCTRCCGAAEWKQNGGRNSPWIYLLL